MAELAVHSVSYGDLYQRWEQSNWQATAIDFSKDRADWDQLNDIQRASMRWQFSMFFWGEDSVTDNLSPYIDAAPTEEQKYFLATQQVDEARHSVFFQRFFNEVLGTGDTVGEGLAACAPQLNWGYRRTFAKLDEVSEALRRDHSKPMFAQAIAMYHLIVEGLLAQPGQHFIEDYLTRMELLPGFRGGMENVSRDEQRHIGFGMKTLSELFAESQECKDAVAELLREVMRYTVSVFIPPEWNRSWTEELGFELEDIYGFGFTSFETKMRAIGYPVEELPPGVLPIDYTLEPRERARRSLEMARAGLIGEPSESPDSSPDAQRLLFDAIERSVDHSAVNGDRVTIQWRFSDAAPWHLRIDNGQTRSEQGEAPDADVTLELSWKDWVDISGGRADPRRKILKRQMRPHGSIRQLWRMQKIFAR